MKAERLLEAIGSVDEVLLERSEQKVFRWKKLCMFVAAAACITLVFAGIHNRTVHNGNTSDGMGSGNGGHADGSAVFMNYEGPVFPLALMQQEEAVTAERNITFDFANYGQESEGQKDGASESVAGYGKSCMVMDDYILENTSDEDKVVTAVYPYAGSFYSQEHLKPRVQVDGKCVEANPLAGIYSNATEELRGVQVPLGIASTGYMDSWEKYKELLSDGSYMQSAFAETRKLSEPVVVYQFTDSSAPYQKYPAATLAMDFTLPEGVKIFSYNIEGWRWDAKTRSCQYSYFVREGKNNNELKALVVLDGDIGDYTLQGYEDGGCEENEKAADITAKVTRRETTLGALLQEVLDDYCTAAEYTRGEDVDDMFERGQIYAVIAEYFNQFGQWDADVTERIEGRLNEIIDDIVYAPRVFYLPFEVVIPANGSVRIQACLLKEPSFDFECKGTGNAGIDGYDMVTRLGSNLDFIRQTAAMEDRDAVEIVRQSFGFDLKRGVKKVELDLEQEHYYLEVRQLERH